MSLHDQSLIDSRICYHQLTILQSIILHLNSNIFTLCTYPTIDYAIIRKNIEDILPFLEKTVSNDFHTSDERLLLSEIGWQSHILALLVEERVNLEYLDSHPVTPVANRDTCNENCSELRTPRRFSKLSVQILNNWYLFNSEFPYLNIETSDYLAKRCGLSRKQVQNWVSNKRRKDRKKNASNELLETLSESVNPI